MLGRAGKKDIKVRGDKRYRRTPVTTYYRTEAGPAAQSPFQKRLPKKNRRRYLLGAADILLICVLLAVLVYSLLLSGSPAVVASDNSYHTNRDYEQLIRQEFSGVTSHNKVTFDEPKLVSRIEARFPEVTAASIELPFFSEQPKVRLAISTPIFKLQSPGLISIVDLQGVVVAKDTGQPRFSALPIVKDQSGFNAQLGKPVLSSQAAGFINTIIRQCRRAKVPISTLTLPAVPLEFDLRAMDQPYLVKFYFNGDANTEAGQFLAARQKFDSNHITPSQYLDVRVSGKIFYK